MVALPPLGVKRICPNCGARFYDLNKKPALCPKCGKSHDPATQFRARSRRRPAAQEAQKDALQQKPKLKKSIPDDEEDAEIEGFGSIPGGGEELEEMDEADDIESIGELDEIETEEESEDMALEGDVDGDGLIDEIDDEEEILIEDEEEEGAPKPKGKGGAKKGRK